MAQEQANVTPTSFMDRVLSWITGSETRLSSIDAALSKLASTQEQLTKATADLDQARQTIQSLTEQNKNLTAASVAVTERASALEKREKEVDAEVERKANLIAGQKLSKVGVPAVAEETTSNPLTPGKSLTLTEQCLAANKAKAK